MNPRHSKLYLRDVAAYARRAIRLVDGMTEDEFVEDERTNLAVARCIEIIGEAAKSVPMDVRALVPDVPWRQITRTRDILAHHYFGARLDVIWSVTQNDLLPLAEAIEKLLTLTAQSAESEIDSSGPPPTMS